MFFQIYREKKTSLINTNNYKILPYKGSLHTYILNSSHPTMQLTPTLTIQVFRHCERVGAGR